MARARQDNKTKATKTDEHKRITTPAGYVAEADAIVSRRRSLCSKIRSKQIIKGQRPYRCNIWLLLS